MQNALNILAVYKEYDPYQNRWILYNLIENNNRPLLRRKRKKKEESGVESYENPEKATSICIELNQIYKQKLISRDISNEIKKSLELKTQKALDCHNRRQEEEELMILEAKKTNKNLQKKEIEDFKGNNYFSHTSVIKGIEAEKEKLKKQFNDIIKEFPYLDSVLLRMSDNRPVITFKEKNGWSYPFYANQRGCVFAERAKIANGFKLRSRDHWGKTKSKIRKIINKKIEELINFSEVQSALDKFLKEGKYALRWHNCMFWYEEELKSWQFKKILCPPSKDGRTIWKEGTIKSKNLGQIIVLPYIKENGEYVNGHTKNVPHQGKAKLREEIKEIPFEELNHDQMIDLYGNFFH